MFSHEPNNCSDVIEKRHKHLRNQRLKTAHEGPGSRHRHGDQAHTTFVPEATDSWVAADHLGESHGRGSRRCCLPPEGLSSPHLSDCVGPLFTGDIETARGQSCPHLRMGMGPFLYKPQVYSWAIQDLGKPQEGERCSSSSNLGPTP